MARPINNSDFQELLQTTGVYLIDFWAGWCGPCKIMDPVIEELSKDKDLEKVNFLKVNVDEQPELAGKFGVTSIPTFYLIKTTGDGGFDLENNKIDKYVGAQSPFDFKTNILDSIKNLDSSIFG